MRKEEIKVVTTFYATINVTSGSFSVLFFLFFFLTVAVII